MKGNVCYIFTGYEWEWNFVDIVLVLEAMMTDLLIQFLLYLNQSYSQRCFINLTLDF